MQRKGGPNKEKRSREWLFFDFGQFRLRSASQKTLLPTKKNPSLLPQPSSPEKSSSEKHSPQPFRTHLQPPLPTSTHTHRCLVPRSVGFEIPEIFGIVTMLEWRSSQRRHQFVGQGLLDHVGCFPCPMKCVVLVECSM